MVYEIHPLAELIPAMGDDEYTELKADIEQNGVRMPVTVYEEKILDGRHRARACQELGLSVEAVPYVGDDPTGFVISLNLRRRHLTIGQCAMAARKLLGYETEKAKERMAEGGRKAAPGVPAERSPQMGTPFPASRTHSRKAVDEAGARFGVSGKSVERADRIATESPELAERVERGEMKLNTAFREITGERTKQERQANKPAPAPQTERQIQLVAKRIERIWNGLHSLAVVCPALAESDIASISEATTDKDLRQMVNEAKTAVQHLKQFISNLEGVS